MLIGCNSVIAILLAFFGEAAIARRSKKLMFKHTNEAGEAHMTLEEVKGRTVSVKFHILTL